jgi:hypothetical protein
MEASEREGREMVDRWNALEARVAEREQGRPEPPKRCPRCGAKAKQGTKGKWFCDNADAHSTVYLIPDEGAPGWLEHIGIKEPLPPIPQANIGDGGMCLDRGVYESGGGGSSGRKRKKDPKKRKLGPGEFFNF